MKLELKHFSSYYPYDLKVQYYHDERGRMAVCEISELRKDELTISNSDYQWEVEFYEVRPILRPLSDLTKDEFRDIVEQNDFVYDRRNGWGTDLTIGGNSLHWGFNGNFNTLSALFQNHFDVFGLIDLKLAIDINTLGK